MTETSGAVDIRYWTLWGGTQRITCDGEGLRSDASSPSVLSSTTTCRVIWAGGREREGLSEQQRDCSDGEKEAG